MSCRFVLKCAGLLLAAVLVFSLLPVALNAGEVLIGQDGRLAVIGDSITEQKQYSKNIEIYVLACAGRKDVQVFQFGWSGERAPGFAGRMENDLMFFNPTVITTCYGMNDGSYQPINDQIKKTYTDGMRTIITKLQKMGVKGIVIGSPGAVDTKTYKPGQKFADGQESAISYNQNLKALRDIDEQLAQEYNVTFADVFTPIHEAMAKAKAAYGDAYDVCGKDGVHPGPNGHLAMAYSFIKALGFDGNIAEIDIDMKGGAVTSAGHKVLSAQGGKAEIESERYPFCFDPDPKSSNSNRSILPYLPFNQDLNRFTLKVKNLDTDKAKVTWGSESMEFTRQQLEAGVNLAAEFTKTPFDDNFKKLMQLISVKQNFETMAIKQLITNFRMLRPSFAKDPEMTAALETIQKGLRKSWEKLNADVHAALVPVKYAITVEPVK